MVLWVVRFSAAGDITSLSSLFSEDTLRWLRFSTEFCTGGTVVVVPSSSSNGPGLSARRRTARTTDLFRGSRTAGEYRCSATREPAVPCLTTPLVVRVDVQHGTLRGHGLMIFLRCAILQSKPPKVNHAHPHQTGSLCKAASFLSPVGVRFWLFTCLTVQYALIWYCHLLCNRKDKLYQLQ